MPISSEEFVALDIDDIVYVNDSISNISGTIWRLYKAKVIGRTPKGLLKVRQVDGSERQWTFISERKERGAGYRGAVLLTEAEFNDCLKRKERYELSWHLNSKLQAIGKMSTRINEGDEILMALADATAKAKIFYKHKK